MTDKLVYQYIEIFGDFTDQPTFPDPVIYKNIMYSGHLAQMISLYESITGDMTFSTEGWQFDWGSSTEYPTPINYTTSLLVDNMYKQTLAYEIGGVPCEPDSIFIICNNYMVNALHLHDVNHNSSYEASAGPVWQSTIEKKGINRIPPVPGMDNNYFNLDYLIKPLGIWEPIASVGSDAWALAWMKTWWNSSNSLDSQKKLNAAFDAIYSSSQWVNESIDGSAAVHLHSTDASAKLIPLNDMITTSFYPMIEKQFFTAACVKTGECISKISSVHRYFESNMGHYFDSDGDGMEDSYHYNPALMSNGSGDADVVIGNYTVWITSNLLLGMMTEELSESVLQELFQYATAEDKSIPYYQRLAGQPKVLEVEYPHVMVSSAVYHPSASAADEGRLTFSLVAGDKCSVKGATLTVTLRAEYDKIARITMNDQIVKIFVKGSGEGTVVLTSEAVWESCVDGSRMEFVVYFR